MIWLWLSIILIQAGLGWQRRRALERALGQVRVDIEMAQDCDVAWLDLALDEIKRALGPRRKKRRNGPTKTEGAK